MFNDQEKAFDFVNCDILWSQLKVYGITGKDSALLKSYIKDKYQRVIICNTCLHCKIFSN
jgi:hypothetical protein